MFSKNGPRGTETWGHGTGWSTDLHWIRIHHTDYDKLRMQGKEREAACEAVRDDADSVFREWQGSFESPDAP